MIEHACRASRMLRRAGRYVLMCRADHDVRGERARCCLTTHLKESPPVTPLDKPLRREIDIDGQLFTLTIDPTGLKLVEKGHHKGIELAWKDVANGDAAIAAALQASLQELR